jgi:hypothetical protein
LAGAANDAVFATVARELAAIFEFRRRFIESADSNFFAEGRLP